MKLSSSAFPPQRNPPTLSKVHEQFQKHLLNNPFPEPNIRKYQKQDLQQLKILQKQWFPLNYGEQFYLKILQGLAQCFVAEVTLILSPSQQPIKAVVGAIVFEDAVESDHLLDGWINRMLNLTNNSLYIMTLGVIDEMRSKGLAKRLLNEAIIYTQSRPKIKLIALHVVTYNQQAINFYKKMGFCLLQKIDDHYHIMGLQFGGLKLGYFVNGGIKRQGWGSWFKRILLRKNTNQQWPI